MNYFGLSRFLMFTLVCIFIAKITQADDKPCAARSISNRSVVCVCNSTYCDTITRKPPAAGQFVAYTTSESGLRFQKFYGSLVDRSCRRCEALVVDPTVTYQKVEGFGGGVTDSVGINWKNVSEELQKHFISSYFSNKGIQYNMVRVPIGGSDFSVRGYAYNEMPEDDVKLSNFSLVEEDYKYKIPLIKAAMEASSEAIHVLATTWSPPAWMKTNNNLSGLGQLKPEYYQTYADYHCKFIAEYAKQGITTWGITTSNEPTHGLTIDTSYVCIGWTPCQMGKFIEDYLGETIRKCTDKSVKILTLDDERGLINTWWHWLAMSSPNALKYIDGLAVHFYADFDTPNAILTNFTRDYPGKILLGSEACEGVSPGQTVAVDLGSWDRAKSYATDILSDLANDVTGWIDWNMALNEQGGPNYVKNYVDSPVIVMADRDEFVKQPMYYALGHFSKFIPRDSLRVKVVSQKRGVEVTSAVQYVAFLTPKKTIVTVIYNDSRIRTIEITIGTKQAQLKLLPNSITTVELPYEADPVDSESKVGE